MIQAQNISFEIDGCKLLDNVNLQIQEKSRVAIIGPTGCGKSILLKALAGILVPTAGEVLLFGNNLLNITEKENLNLRRRIGFMFQDGALWENKSVYQNLELPLLYHRPELKTKEAEKIIMNLLSDAGLSHERNNRPAVLSQGEFRMVSFLRSIVLEPELLFLDQPEIMLDPVGISFLERNLERFIKKEASMMFITSNSKWITNYSTHLLVMDRGEVLAYGPTKELLAQASPEVQKIIRKIPDIDLLFADDILRLLGSDQNNEI